MNPAMTGFKFLREMENKAVIGVYVVTVKGSGLVIRLGVLVNGIIMLEIVPHTSYWYPGMLTTKTGVYTILEVISAEVVGGVNLIFEPI